MLSRCRMPLKGQKAPAAPGKVECKKINGENEIDKVVEVENENMHDITELYR